MLRSLLGSSVVVLSLAACLQAEPFTVERGDDGVTVKHNGELVTRYVTNSGGKPILFPIVGPTGKEMTRGWPMRDAQSFEKQDHIHHRSVWFTHGNVNGVDFWAESGKNGTIEHQEFLKVEGGETATIVARNHWLAPDGQKVCEDERTVRVGADKATRWIDFDITLKATDGQVRIGDTKEGTFGVRVHETMKVDAKKGGKIVNSEGLTDGAAWGKPAAWVDYHGPVDDETLGIAILNHPKSFRFPTPWHVRTYGLFAANPFGLKDFGTGKDGAAAIEAGDSLTLRYRVILHQGDEKEGRIAEAYEAYAQ